MYITVPLLTNAKSGILSHKIFNNTLSDSSKKQQQQKKTLSKDLQGHIIPMFGLKFT